MFLKKLFCKHIYPKIHYTTNCVEVLECEKCGKKKKYYFHDYKEIGRSLERKVFTSFFAGSFRSTYLKQIYQCEKCGDIYSKDTLI